MNIWIILETIGVIMSLWYFLDVNTDGDFDLPHVRMKDNWERIFKKVREWWSQQTEERRKEFYIFGMLGCIVGFNLVGIFYVLLY